MPQYIPVEGRSLIRTFSTAPAQPSTMAKSLLPYCSKKQKGKPNSPDCTKARGASGKK